MQYFDKLHTILSLYTVPADNSCSRLPPVVNGGTVYSDLNLSPGTTGRYMCNAGYTLHGERQEFVCTVDGVWDGDVTEVPVACKCKTVKTALNEVMRV